MNVGEINNTIQGYLNNQEIAGGALLVRRNGERRGKVSREGAG